MSQIFPLRHDCNYEGHKSNGMAATLSTYLDLNKLGVQKGSSCGHQCNDSSGLTTDKHLGQ